MGRSLGRVGGATAGTIAIIFGVLDLLNEVPPPWIPIALGVIAIVGVIADYFIEKKDSDPTPSSVKQKQVGGTGSTGLQAGRDITDVRIGRDEDPAADGRKP